MQSYPFDFRGARIITGMDEGAYGWITINYLLEGFVKVRDSLEQVQNLYLQYNLNNWISLLHLHGSTISNYFPLNSMHLMVNGFTLKLGQF